ncbi:MAG TPA: metalloregulator ArsR/SmtB family transcription factor [Candidatus Polarisedimenticolaceae bacterium]|nr:metalloregulator ArsR/SmtB family transcription factor [Candidatus Polarisedimenticolaceae bacterium]
MNTMRRFGSRCCPAPGERPLSAAQADRAARNLELLAHPIRLTLLGILCRRGGEVCVCDLEAAVPVKQPTVSHHLRILREAGLVEAERRGQWAHYRIDADAMAMLSSRIEDVLDALRPRAAKKERRA